MKKKRILIVEDQGITALDEAQTVRNMGYDVTGYALTGEDAIRMADSDRPDLILMDIMLAGDMDGREANREIQKIYSVPVVYVTAYGNKAASRKPGFLPPDNIGYIVKPFTNDELEAEIERLIG